jgi:ABC-type nitrate/sulfonate/bicarbonate transport system permease component
LNPSARAPASRSASPSSSCSRAWAFATLGGYVSKTFLADPITMVQDGWLLLTKFGFAYDIGMTIWRVVGGFVLAALIAVPLGILMGAYKPVEAFFEPFVSFARYLPASAFVPLLILWAGIGEAQKLLVIFIGPCFSSSSWWRVGRVPRRDLVEAAYTLGLERRRGAPGAHPGQRAGDRRDPAARARLGLDLRDRGGADRLVLRHRPHDHRQPGAHGHEAR